jgi:hypothetical protein
MKEAGTIDKQVFSFYINFDEKVKSKMTFGGHDLDSYAAEGA